MNNKIRRINDFDKFDGSCVLNVTNKSELLLTQQISKDDIEFLEQLNYIGFSQGTTDMFVLLSENPNFADKIQRFICLSAVMFQSDLDIVEVLVHHQAVY